MNNSCTLIFVCKCWSQSGPIMDTWVSEQDERSPAQLVVRQHSYMYVVVIVGAMLNPPPSDPLAVGQPASRSTSPASRSITSASLSHLKTPNCTVAGQWSGVIRLSDWCLVPITKFTVSVGWAESGNRRVFNKACVIDCGRSCQQTAGLQPLSLSPAEGLHWCG